MVKYVTPREATQTLGVHERTLRRWHEEGKIEAIWTEGKQRRYNVESYTARAKSGVDTRIDILYARVSSHAQKPDLDRQVEYLRDKYPGGEVVSEIGGGLNFKRKKMLTVLGRIMSGDIKRLVVAHKDRLARFGFDLFRWICEQNRCELVVFNESSLSPHEEMVEDILAILHCFSSRLYGLRKYKTQMQEDPDLPKRRTR
ncbi:IS607 family transposase [Coleofasciculus sp. H7-2]|uniref:IS607 family transposase n=1 Tax=Coleofasciculus sp. H7-2 TaxID=3351545 RepID=UPI00366D04A5